MKGKLREVKGEVDNETLTVRNFIMLLSIMDRITRQKIHKEMEDLNDVISQSDLTDTHKTLNSSRMYIFLNVHERFFRIDHMPGHKTIKKLKRSTIIQND